LRIEVQTDLPEGTKLNAAIADEKTGDNLISDVAYVTVSGGQFVVEDFATDRNDKPLRSGHYWLSIAQGTDPLPLAAVMPIIVPKRPKHVPAKENAGTADAKAADPDEVSDMMKQWKKEDAKWHKKNAAFERHLQQRAVSNDALPQSAQETDRHIRTLINSGADQVVVAKSEDAYSELTKTIGARDETGLNELTSSGQVFVVPVGTKVRVLEGGILTSEIRIVSGAYSGTRGFVATVYLSPEN
jgi:hypothetical protein